MKKIFSSGGGVSMPVTAEGPPPIFDYNSIILYYYNSYYNTIYIYLFITLFIYTCILHSNTLMVTEKGEVWSWGWNEHGNCGTGTVENVSSPQCLQLPYSTTLIASGGGHSLALTTS